jgi:hypothetical protein
MTKDADKKAAQAAAERQADREDAAADERREEAADARAEAQRAARTAQASLAHPTDPPQDAASALAHKAQVAADTLTGNRVNAARQAGAPVERTPATHGVLIENPPAGEPLETLADEPVNRDAQTLFVSIGGRRWEHCATRADGRWVYRAS